MYENIVVSLSNKIKQTLKYKYLEGKMQQILAQKGTFIQVRFPDTDFFF